MSLLEEIMAYRPEYVFDPLEVAEIVDCKFIDSRFVRHNRWSLTYQAVFVRRGGAEAGGMWVPGLDEYVAAEYNVPATEIQEEQATSEFIAYEVEPNVRTMFVYNRKEAS